MFENKLTLICPSYNRQKFLKRSINYWSKTKYRIIIADGSENGIDNTYLNHDNISYHHIKEGLVERILFLLNNIDTPYACLLGDDEFYIPSSLKKCIEFLENNKDYSSAIGRAIGFKKKFENVSFKEQYPLFYGRHLSDDSPIERLNYHFKNYQPSHCYAVTRSEIFKYAYKEAISTQFDLYAIWEIIFEFIVLSMGKSIVLPNLHWLRCYEANPIRNTGDLGMDTNDYDKKFEVWWVKNKFKIQRDIFCQKLSKLSKNKVSKRDVKLIFNNFDSNQNLFIKFRNIYCPSFIRKILEIFPKAKSKIKLFLEFSNKNQIFKKLKSEGVSIDSDDLKLCINAIKR